MDVGKELDKIADIKNKISEYFGIEDADVGWFSINYQDNVFWKEYDGKIGWADKKDAFEGDKQEYNPEYLEEISCQGESKNCSTDNKYTMYKIRCCMGGDDYYCIFDNDKEV